MLNLNAYFVPVKRNRMFLKIQIGQKKGEGQKTGQCTDINVPIKFEKLYVKS